MSRKKGALFSKAMFGYKCSDVNEYIRDVDQAHSDEVVRINIERDLLSERLQKAEERIEELEATIKSERNTSQEKLKKIVLEYEKKLAEMSEAQNAVKDKLSESETRASSYLKLADSSSLRAESAEAELSVISAALDDSRTEIEDLNEKLAQKEEEIQRISEIEALAKKMIESNAEKAQDRKRKSIFRMFPIIIKGKHIK